MEARWAFLTLLSCAVSACGSDAAPDDCQPSAATPVTCTDGDGCRIVQVSSGFRFTCARRENGEVLCWGENRSGNLGDGSRTCWATPVRVTGVDAAMDVAARLSHACVIIEGAAVRCWGANDFGQLGDGTNDDRQVPVDAIGLQDSAALAQGAAQSSCVTQSIGSASCWGRNEFGMLGTGSTGDQAAPVPVLLSEVSQLASGRLHACAVHGPGALSCWGRNAEGQIGDGTREDRGMPSTVPNIATGSTGGMWVRSHLLASKRRQRRVLGCERERSARTRFCGGAEPTTFDRCRLVRRQGDHRRQFS